MEKHKAERATMPAPERPSPDTGMQIRNLASCRRSIQDTRCPYVFGIVETLAATSLLFFSMGTSALGRAVAHLA